MVSVVAVFRGEELRDLQLVATTTRREIVSDVAKRLLQEEARTVGDRALDSLWAGRNQALSAIAGEGG
jgi:hypothetical protein